ncbi:MAG: beta strand repeat-containing protein [Stellaceae bacterium]
MAVTDTWIGTASADWGASAANWSGGFPTSNSKVVINTANDLTIGFGFGDTFTVSSLIVGNDFFDMSSGSLTVAGAASFGKGYTQSGGTFTSGGAVTIKGAASLIGGTADGKTAFTVGGATTLANYTFGGSAVLDNTGATLELGQITLGDATGVNASVSNKAGAVFNIVGDFGIGQGNATASFVNAGTLAKLGGIGTSTVAVNLSDTGAITVATGTIELRGAKNSLSGAISGAAGQLLLDGGGQDKISGAATVTTGGFAISDNLTLVTLGKNLTYSGNFSLANSAIVDLGRFTLTLSGSETLANNAASEGSGKLLTASGSDASLFFFTLGGTLDWQNSGLVVETGGFTIGDASGTAATFTNEKGGVFSFANDNGIGHGVSLNSRFVNLAGATLKKTGGNGTSQILVDLSDNGAIAVARGTLELRGAANTIAGAVTGAGTLLLDGGTSDKISGGAAISTAGLVVSDGGTLVTLGKNLSYGGSFVLQNSAVLALGGVTLTLSGADTFAGSAAIDGSGVLVTRSNADVEARSVTIGGAIEWQNSGVVGNTGAMTLGDTSFDTVTFTNEKGGVYNFTSDNGIAVGAALDTSFVNLAGATLEKTGGNGISTVAPDVVDAGTVRINTGTIEFTGISNSFAGAISGNGEFELGLGGNTMIASGAAIATKTFVVTDTNTVATLGENLSFAGSFGLGNFAAFDLGGFSLTLSGTDAFLNSSATEGAGSLVTAAGGSALVSSFTLGGAVGWQNAGSVVEIGALTIGDGSFDAATFTNEKGGVYDFVNDSGIGIGAMPNSKFVNLAGATLEKTAGLGDSMVAVPVTNSGAVIVASGEIEFQNTISGAGSFTIRPDTTLQFDGSVAKTARVNFSSTSGGDLLLLDAPQFGAAIHGFGGTGTDEIDLRDVNFSSPLFRLGYTGNTTQGVLTATDGTNTASLTMFGKYTKASFHASADGLGGTQIFDPPAKHTILAVGSV